MTHEGQKAFRAAQGYLELGMMEEAAEELKTVPEKDRRQRPFLQVEVVVLMKLERWEAALSSATRLCEIDSADSSGFIHRAFCLHELKRTEEARQVLMEGPSTLKDEPIYFYNLGCYEAVLGHREAALELVRRSISLDESLRAVALKDTDLMDIWPMLTAGAAQPETDPDPES